MEYCKNMGVYEVVPRSQIDECGGKLIDTRWIDTNKADELNPEYRSRLVGRKSKTGKDDSLYASAPPTRVVETDRQLGRYGEEDSALAMPTS